MPAYFYHLAFELYPHSTAEEGKHIKETVFLPPAGTDIFESSLPVHRSTPWGQSQPTRPLHKRTKTDPSHSERPKPRTISFAPSSANNRPHLALHTSTTRASKTTGSSSNIENSDLSSHKLHTDDWRFESITIESIDMAPLGENDSRPRGKSLSHNTNAEHSSGGGLDTRAKFIPADAKNTDIGWGVVHLYRDAHETQGLIEEQTDASSSGGDVSKPFKEEECTTLCILAVPSYMMPSDLLGWVGEKAREEVSHFRLIRTGQANRYMVLMKFYDAKEAKAWRNEWNGKLFNSMEPEFCHVVFVQSITFQSSDNSQQPSSFPDMNNDPFNPMSQLPANTPTSATTESSAVSAALTTKPFAPPTPNLVELPTCPVCLERMDETTGLLTILCQHVFHCACLEKWKGSGCPVCRYTQHNSASGTGRLLSHNDTENVCSVCSADQNLWICLICGNVGCGRYDSAHAFAHYESTSHSYAMDVTTQHVWDYAGDGYVHRLIQNKSDGQLVDLPAAWASNGKGVSGGMAAMGADMVPREKMETMGAEYTYLLQSQLENQRSYFEEQLERAVDKASQASAAAEKATAQMEEMLQSFAQLRTNHQEAQSSIRSLEKDLERATRKAEKTDALAKKLAKDWKEEKTMNEALMEKVQFLDGKLKAGDERLGHLEAEKTDLEEQNRDLIFSITGGEKLQELKDAGEDIDGTIGVVPGKKRKGKGKK
ncbi:zf-UBP-domain-containing protein [Tothia fuscella]|uniref:Zf-UBP-domain-containing protein n=1 Tax=Tothia fuscella TaxID=1048955 RepID=A0A9P4U2V7_9PEZI|nr:zf-UBP-domain-containing protein [Tothia fuscella]